MERILKQPVVVSNTPGAAGGVGNHFVASRKPDGYTLKIRVPVTRAEICAIARRAPLDGPPPAH